MIFSARRCGPHLRGCLGSFLTAVTLAFSSGGANAVDAPPILLAKKIDAGVDVTRYLVSEKFDGVRATWDGKVLRFRSGNVVNAPAWFLARLPREALDGELWLGRGQFEMLSGFVRRTVSVDEEWARIKFMIFELPGAAGTFEARYDAMRQIVDRANWPQLVVVEQTRVASRSELQRRLNAMVRAGGEGLMLHRADAPYVTGRSDVLLKLKPLDDTEAVVVEHIPGKGKYAGMLGALRVEAPDGKRFVIGTGFSDAVRRDPPAVGATITYNFRGLTRNGLPRFASFMRVREQF